MNKSWGWFFCILACAALTGFAFVKTMQGSHSKPGAATGKTRATPLFTPASDGSARARVSENYGKIPLSFEANRGQVDPRVKFLSRGKGYTLALTPVEAFLLLEALANTEAESATGAAGRTPPGSVLRLQLLGANANARVEATDVLPGKSNYFIGSDPRKWRTNIPTYNLRGLLGSFVSGHDSQKYKRRIQPVTSSTPGGRYEFSSRVLDPVTGKQLSHDYNMFHIYP